MCIRDRPKTSRQNQKPHGKNKIPHGKTKTKNQKQNSFGFAMGICFCREIFGFCCEVFGFAVRSLVLPWGFWFCREVFCFCREVFGFAVRYFVFAVRFLVLPWQLWATVPKGSFWLKMKYFEISVLTANSLYIYRQPLLNQRRRNRVPQYYRWLLMYRYTFGWPSDAGKQTSWNSNIHCC